MQSETATSAYRLCKACGMCCNGVLFQEVNLSTTDSPKDLKAVGLKLKTKRGQCSFQQPCTAFRNSACAIYQKRPQRCQLFNCRQLIDVSSGKQTEELALKKISEAHRLSSRVKELLWKSGSTNLKRSLLTRYETVMAQPVESLTDGVMRQCRLELVAAMRDLESHLSRDFRVNSKSSEYG